MPSDVRFADVVRLFKRNGWHLHRVRGSHHTFKSPAGQVYTVPVHRGMVRYVYYREIKKLLGED